MKKTLTTILVFAAVLAALLGTAFLAERRAPDEAAAREPAPTATPVIANKLDEAGATDIRLSAEEISVTGRGAAAEDGVVTIGYPGTYRISGALAAGQLVVDCGDFDGGVYLLLDGVSVACPDGPALYIKQADRTVVHLMPGTENSLADGADYLISEKQEQQTGAGIYSADDLVIEGEGALTVTGNSADGIRSKDSLTVTGGQELRIYSADDGLQASDYIAVEGGIITVFAGGDGLSTTEGSITVSDGNLAVASAGDGISAVTELTVSGGAVSAVTYGGADNYEAAALAEISAKGLKAESILLSGGSVSLDTADDAVHGEKSVTVSGGDITLRTGDDAFRAGEELTISGGAVAVARSGEAMEAESVRISGGTVTAAADNNGVDAGEGGFIMDGGRVSLTAPRCVGSEGVFTVALGSLSLSTDGTEAPLAFAEGSVTGGTVTLVSALGDGNLLTERGELDGSLLFLFPAGVTEESLTLADASGGAVMTVDGTAGCRALLCASGALGVGQSYTVTAGEETLEAAVGEGCAVVSGAQSAAAFSRGGMMPGMPGMPGMP